MSIRLCAVLKKLGKATSNHVIDFLPHIFSGTIKARLTDLKNNDPNVIGIGHTINNRYQMMYIWTDDEKTHDLD